VKREALLSTFHYWSCISITSIVASHRPDVNQIRCKRNVDEDILYEILPKHCVLQQNHLALVVKKQLPSGRRFISEMSYFLL
jgi:hypothetical protein